MCLAGRFHHDFEGASSSCGTDSSNGDSLKNRHESPISAQRKVAEQEAYIPDTFDFEEVVLQVYQI